MMIMIIALFVAFFAITVYMNVKAQAPEVEAADNLNATIEASADRIIAILEDYPNTKMIYWGED